MLSGELWYRSNRDLEAFSRLAHFLKGSSAALGLIKVQGACEDILVFSFGRGKTGEAEAETRLSDSDSSSSSSSSSFETHENGEILVKCRGALDVATQYYREVSVLLQEFYSIGLIKNNAMAVLNGNWAQNNNPSGDNGEAIYDNDDNLDGYMFSKKQ